MSLQPSPSARRAVEVVRFLADHPEDAFAAAELARRLGQSRATCQAVLLALEAAGWVRRGESTRYRLGPGLIPIGFAAQRSGGLVDLLRHAVEDLHAALGREVTGGLPAGDQLVTVARAGPKDPFAVGMGLGHSFPLAPPFGLSFIASDAGEIDQWLARIPGLGRESESGLRHAAALAGQLGYSVLLDPATRRALEAIAAALPEAERAELNMALAQDECATIDPGQRRTMRVSHLSAPVAAPDGRVVALMGVLLGPDDAAALVELAAGLRAGAAALGHILASVGAAGASRQSA